MTRDDAASHWEDVRRDNLAARYAEYALCEQVMIDRGLPTQCNAILMIKRAVQAGVTSLDGKEYWEVKITQVSKLQEGEYITPNGSTADPVIDDTPTLFMAKRDEIK